MKVTEEMLENQRDLVKKLDNARNDLINKFKTENKLLILMQNQYNANLDLENYKDEYRELKVAKLPL